MCHQQAYPKKNGKRKFSKHKDSDKRRDPEMTGREEYGKSKNMSKYNRPRILFFCKLC